MCKYCYVQKDSSRILWLYHSTAVLAWRWSQYKGWGGGPWTCLVVEAVAAPVLGGAEGDLQPGRDGAQAAVHQLPQHLGVALRGLVAVLPAAAEQQVAGRRTHSQTGSQTGSQTRESDQGVRPGVRPGSQTRESDQGVRPGSHTGSHTGS